MNAGETPVGGVTVLAIGVWMLLFQAHFEAWRQRRHAEALAARHARGRNAYFEELRALEAYPPPAVSPPMQRLLGALLILVGGSQIVLIATR